ncbi:MAG: twin-arginine translocation signal domain-containing protein [Limisphaerales bacterium]
MLNESAIIHSPEITRRNFITSTGAAAASLAMLHTNEPDRASPTDSARRSID